MVYLIFYGKFYGGFCVEFQCIENREVRVCLFYEQGDFGAAKNDTLSAAAVQDHLLF